MQKSGAKVKFGNKPDFRSAAAGLFTETNLYSVNEVDQKQPRPAAIVQPFA